ncbi:MAG: type VI secretion system-associated protein TagF [Variovorax sp.]|nr:MAG: type VI secretion system-associated protein TagF [Variovorax sp.]
MSVTTAPAVGALPGWFGKLPGIGDFAHRRLPEAFRETWDTWLQTNLLTLRERHEDWVARYLEGPLWFFVLGEQVAGANAWIGVLMPSVDGVGRYFPFTLAAELALPPDPARMQHWWTHASQAALEGLEQDLDAVAFDALLTRRFEGTAPVDGTGVLPALPQSGQSVWCTDPADAGAAQMTTAGLPRGPRFEALFGFADASDPEVA